MTTPSVTVLSLLHTGFDKCWLGKQVWASLHQLVLDGEAAARGAASFCCEGGKDDRPRFTGRRTASEPDRHRYAGTGGMLTDGPTSTVMPGGRLPLG